MNSRDEETMNPYILKREGKFIEALHTYADELALAHNEGNEYIAQMCFDQMVDVKLLNLLKKNRRFGKVSDLKREIGIHLKKVVCETEALDGCFQDYFDSSWEKFGRMKNGRPLMSVRKDQLIGSVSDTDDRIPYPRLS